MVWALNHPCKWSFQSCLTTTPITYTRLAPMYKSQHSTSYPSPYPPCHTLWTSPITRHCPCLFRLQKIPVEADRYPSKPIDTRRRRSIPAKQFPFLYPSWSSHIERAGGQSVRYATVGIGCQAFVGIYKPRFDLRIEAYRALKRGEPCWPVVGVFAD